MLESEDTILWRRTRLLIVGEGGSGKTSFFRALRNLPFIETASTAGAETATVEATALHDWEQMDGTDSEKVTLQCYTCACLRPYVYKHVNRHVYTRQALARIVANVNVKPDGVSART